jgi:hypothetical protein
VYYILHTFPLKSQLPYLASKQKTDPPAIKEAPVTVGGGRGYLVKYEGMKGLVIVDKSEYLVPA